VNHRGLRGMTKRISLEKSSLCFSSVSSVVRIWLATCVHLEPH
jgi:hypothetical protein